jgi:FkbM family methyltransferase
MTISAEDVHWCYQRFLNRMPESKEVVDAALAGVSDWKQLVFHFLESHEFRDIMARSSEHAFSSACFDAVEYCADTIISFAQNGEDILFYRAFQCKKNGTFIDIGAGHPIADNVTLWLRMRGWRGVNIEPNPIFFDDLITYRPDDTNLNVGVSDKVGELTYYQVEQNELGHGWGLSSFDPACERLAREQGLKVNHLIIPVTTLDDIAVKYGRRGIDLLKIDVEGLEAAIISSTDWSRFTPQLICVEAVEPNSAVPTWHKWESFLLDAGYRFAAFDGVNCYYCRRTDSVMLRQLSAPVCCNDFYRAATKADIEAAMSCK